MVSSTGLVYEGAEGADDERLLYAMYDTGIGRRCEVEGLGHDPTDEVLLIACKAPREDGLEDLVSVFRWSPDTRELLDPPILIPLADVEEATDQRGFATSGIVRDPTTGVYVLVSAQDRALVSVTPAGEVLSGTRLDEDLHRQAEGIAITPDGTLWIADEGRSRQARLTAYAAGS